LIQEKKIQKAPSVADIISKLSEKEEKLRKLRVYGRWKTLTHDLLLRSGNQMNLKT